VAGRRDLPGDDQEWAEWGGSGGGGVGRTHPPQVRGVNGRLARPLPRGSEVSER